MALQGSNVRVESERESDRGWVFELRAGETPADHHELHLSWADYEYWSHGVAPPSRVAQAVIEGLGELRPDAELGFRLDASTARRIAGAARLDEWMREHL